MSLAAQIAKHFKELHYGGNSTGVNLKDSLANVTWQQANMQVYDLNTIATLTYHINYYVHMVSGVLQGGPLIGNDKLSFTPNPIQSQEDWDGFLEKVWADAELFTELVAQMPDSQFHENFLDGRYGNYYRNIVGLIEHIHYHLGQIVLIKKIIAQGSTGQ